MAGWKQYLALISDVDIQHCNEMYSVEMQN